MPASTETSIWLALKSAIQNAAGSLPIAWPSETFEPPTSGADLLPFLSVGKVTVPPMRVLIGRGDHDRSGSVTLVYVAPMGNPAEFYIEKAAGIAANFPEDRRMRFGAVCLRVTSRPHVADGYQDRGYWRTPIIVRWQGFF